MYFAIRFRNRKSLISSREPFPAVLQVWFKICCSSVSKIKSRDESCTKVKQNSSLFVLHLLMLNTNFIDASVFVTIYLVQLGGVLLQISQNKYPTLTCVIILCHAERLERIPWIAPECIDSGSNIGSHADQWSFGVTMLEIYNNGDLPFNFNTLSEVGMYYSSGFYSSFNNPKYHITYYSSEL